MTSHTAPARPYRPRRSVLYMPASNARAIEKARSLDVDGVILDLEDAVAPDAKVEAREAACAAVIDGGFGHRELVIRVNGIGTPWHEDDLRLAARSGADGIAVPKVNSADEVRSLVDALDAAGAPESLLLWAMVETPAAFLRVAEIAAASPRLAVLVMGTNDLVKELDAQHLPGRAPLLPALGLALLGAKAAGKVILDGVYNDVKNTAGFEDECHQAWAMGFDGKTLIHPGQVAAANATWAPSPVQVADARELIETFETAMAARQGVVTFRGRMIENLHVDQARKVLQVARALEGRA